MRLQKTYDQEFFDEREGLSLQSARIVVPVVLRYVRPRTVVDVGCARGAWLKVFLENGVERVLGIDGPQVDPATLHIDPQCFRAVDLDRAFEIEGGPFDLAVCLETAEHLSLKAGKALVKTLARAAPVVLFSAALPGQGGTHHVNEQWPWFWKRLFEAEGFTRLDPIRREIWQNPAVALWYRQNTFLYASERAIAESPVLQKEAEIARQVRLELVNGRILRRGVRFSNIFKEYVTRPIRRRLPW